LWTIIDRLNIDQARTLRDALEMIPLIGEVVPTRKALLVHGTFGSGKSFLIAVIILTFIRLVRLSTETSGEVSDLIAWNVKFIFLRE
jgi:hypothetical protein